MKRTLAASIAAGVAALVAAGWSHGGAIAAPIDDLNAVIDDYWSHELEEDPFGATASGVYDYNDRVPDVSPTAQARRLEKARGLRQRLNDIDRDALPRGAQVNAALLDFILEHDVALGGHDPWRVPFLADSGFHTTMGYLVGATPFRTQTDYERYLARLKALPGFIDQSIQNMRVGIEDGYTQPKEIMEKILPSFEALVVEDVEDHPYFAPFLEMPERIHAKRRNALTEEGRRTLERDIAPAMARLATFMREAYLPNARETLGLSDVEGGAAHYAALVRFFTTLDDADPEEIHQLGLREVARIRAEMDAIIEDVAFDGDFAAFIEFLRTDPQFYAKTPRQLLERAAYISKDIDGKLPGFFDRLPRQPYSVEPVPEEIAPNYTTGRYSGAPLNADRGGQYWVNTYELNKRPLYALPALSLHEAVPGHHLQSALAKEIEDVPEFRRNFYPHAFGEGWALYAEKLGVEMDVYETPYDHFGRLSYEMWRACRLVIDTGIHAKGWSRDQAVDYLAANTALSLHNVNTEIDRYIAWPAQALAYKMGELTIWELREKAEAELGDDFDLKAFHNAVLSEGGLPLDMLRERIDEHIAEAKAP